MKRALVSCAAAGFLVPLCWAGTTIYVNAQTGDDARTGLCEVWTGATCGPKRTIQAGIDGAAPGDTVLVADGNYAGEGNSNLDFAGKAIAVRSASGPDGCVIDAHDHPYGMAPGFYFHSGETTSSVIEGFTITKAWGGGISCWGASPTIRRCLIVGNQADPHGGGIVCETGSSPSIENCFIVGNRASSGGGVLCEDSSSPTILSCTFVGNVASNRGGAVWAAYHSAPVLVNCILWGNRSPAGPQIAVVDTCPATVTVSHSDVQGGEAGVLVLDGCALVWGNGNIDGDPVFVAPGTWIEGGDPNEHPYDDIWQGGNCHLSLSSPCIDAGDPEYELQPGDTDIDGEMRIWLHGTPRIDMGADEFHPPKGDLNCDGFVDFDDINPFVAALASHDGYMSAYPNCLYENADINGDGYVDFDDINPFVRCLVHGRCP